MKILGSFVAILVIGAILYSNMVLVESKAGTIVTNSLGAKISQNLKTFK